MAARYRAGAIGRTGRGNYGHGLHTCYGPVDEVDLVALADEDDTGRAKAQEATGAASAYRDYREMLEKERLDIVSVCPRWVDCHEQMIVAALDAGCHVYSEKPMTETLEDADRVIDLADSKGLKIAVAHQAAYLPQVHAIKALIDDGRIGSVRHLRGAGKMDQRGGGEDLLVLGTHLFNLMRLWAGSPVSVYGRVTNGDRHIQPSDVAQAGEPIGSIAGDSVFGHFEFSHGVTGSFESHRREIRDGRPYGLEVVGDAGRIAFDAAGAKVSILADDAYAPWDAEQTRQAVDLDPAPLMSGNAGAIEDLVQAIEGDREPISSARGARTALEMIHGIYASEICGGRVDLPLADRRHPLDAWKSGE